MEKKETQKPYGFWTKEKCLEEAQKYSTIKEWSEKSRTSYVISNLKSWQHECIKHMLELKKPAGYWTPARYQEEGRKYRTVREWKENSAGSYNASINNK